MDGFALLEERNVAQHIRYRRGGVGNDFIGEFLYGLSTQLVGKSHLKSIFPGFAHLYEQVERIARTLQLNALRQFGSRIGPGVSVLIFHGQQLVVKRLCVEQAERFVYGLREDGGMVQSCSEAGCRLL